VNRCSLCLGRTRPQTSHEAALLGMERIAGGTSTEVFPPENIAIAGGGEYRAATDTVRFALALLGKCRFGTPLLPLGYLHGEGSQQQWMHLWLCASAAPRDRTVVLISGLSLGSGDNMDVQITQLLNGRWEIQLAGQPLSTAHLTAAVEVAEAWLTATGEQAAIVVQPSDGIPERFEWGRGSVRPRDESSGAG
jgi:hypothetical protein